MKGRLRFAAVYYLAWVGLFIVTRVLFLAYEHTHATRLDARTLIGILVHGLRMDLSAAAYLTVLPVLVLAVTAAGPPALTRRIILSYTLVALGVVALLTTVDLGIFDAWGIRLDATPLQYLNTPHEMIVSAESSPIARLAGILVLLTLLGLWGYRRLIAPHLEALGRAGWPAAAGLLALTPLLIIPIRGGLQWTPLNQSSVYFSEHEFANQAALNVGWNFFHSLTTAGALERTNPYTELGAAEARHVLDSLRAAPRTPSRALLRLERPNIVLIIWESATAKVFRRLGGLPNVTPHFDTLAHEGILFTAIYASADRSAQGLTALLSGFPAQPHRQIMNTPAKAAKLPTLIRDLGRAGYATSFYYGGELEFANIKSYLLSSGVQRLIGEDAFPRADRNSKWGAHDHVVLGRLLADVPQLPRPFFTTLFTLSSHEPFEIPMRPAFPGRDVAHEFLSAHAYTDRSIGEFVRAAQRQPWWDSTLVIIVADHGHLEPRLTPAGAMPAAALYHIPMLWLGGALATRDTVITRIGSQTDLAPTLLAQLGLPHTQYRWGGDLLAPGTPAFAYFAYRDGFGFVDARGGVVYDVLGGRIMERTGSAGAAEVRAGLAYLRLSYQAYLDN